MSVPRLSATVKGLVNAPHARPHARPVLPHIPNVYRAIARDAAAQNLGLRPWVTISAAVTFTLNSPESVFELYKVATSEPGGEDEAYVAELIREVGLKCISFNGIPRTINGLNAFRASLPEHVVGKLKTTEDRRVKAQTAWPVWKLGMSLWQSIYRPLDRRLFAKLKDAHPDLPSYIVASHYGALLADPRGRGSGVATGRLLTSLIAVSCLRAQTGVAPQVLSHVYGLRKARDELLGDEKTSSAEADTPVGGQEKPDESSQATRQAAHPEDVRAADFLTSDEGIVWALHTIDLLMAGFEGTVADPEPVKSKL